MLPNFLSLRIRCACVGFHRYNEMAMIALQVLHKHKSSVGRHAPGDTFRPVQSQALKRAPEAATAEAMAARDNRNPGVPCLLAAYQ